MTFKSPQIVLWENRKLSLDLLEEDFFVSYHTSNKNIPKPLSTAFLSLDAMT